MAKGRKVAKRRSGIRQFDGSRKYTADDSLMKENIATLFKADKANSDIRWEDIHNIYAGCTKVLDAYMQELNSSSQAYHMRTVATLNGYDFQLGINTYLEYLNRDINNWYGILQQVYEPAKHESGKVPPSRVFEWHSIGEQLSNIMNGIENSLTPLLCEIATFVIIGDQNIIGYNVAELETLSKEQRKALVLSQYTDAINVHNAKGQEQINLKSVLANLSTDRAVKHLN